jgi:TRAP-type C4-dicarboxylate transport system substrate-binding protein
MTAALDHKVAHAMGLKSVHNCEKWVGLTEEEREAIADATIRIHGQEWAYATAIEAKLKEKNT